MAREEVTVPPGDGEARHVRGQVWEKVRRDAHVADLGGRLWRPDVETCGPL